MTAAVLLAFALSPVAADPLPPHAVARLGDDAFHPGGNPNKVAVSPDESRIALGEATGQVVTIWDANTGRTVARFAGQSPLAWSADGKTLAVTLPPTPEDRLARPVVLLDAATGRETARPSEARGVVDFAAFAGPDLFLFARSTDTEVQAWSTQARKVVRRFPRSNRATAKAGAVSPDGRYLAVIGVGTGQVPLHLYDIATGKDRFDVRVPGPVPHLVFSPDGKSVVCGSATLYRYSVPAGELLGRSSQAAKQSGQIACGNDGTIYVLGTVTPPFKAVDFGTGAEAAFPLPGPFLIANRPFPAGLHVIVRGGRLEVWDLKTGRPRHPADISYLPVLAAGFTPSGRPVTATHAGIQSWTTGGALERTTVFPGEAKTTASVAVLSRDGRPAVRLIDRQSVQFFDAAGKMIKAVEMRPPRLAIPALSPDGTRMVYPGSTGLSGWNATTGEKLWELTAKAVADRWSVAAFRPDGRTVVTGGDGGSIREWSADTGRFVRTYVGRPEAAPAPAPPGVVRPVRPPTVAPAGHRGRVEGLVATPDGRKLVSLGTDRTIRVWETASGREIYVLTRTAGRGGTTVGTCPLAVSPDGRLLAAPGPVVEARTRIDVWDLRTGKEVVAFEGHKGQLTALAFSPDGRRLLSGAADAESILWSVPHPAAGPAGTVTPADLAALWAGLAEDDPAKAHAALATALAAPGPVVAVLKENQPPIAPTNRARVDRLIADLDDDLFAVRDKASAGLADLGSVVEKRLREELARTKSAEVASRIKRLLTGIKPGGDLRQRRAVELVETAGTPGAKALLESWATGDPDAVLTTEAAVALTRLKRQSAK